MLPVMWMHGALTDLWVYYTHSTLCSLLSKLHSYKHCAQQKASHNQQTNPENPRFPFPLRANFVRSFSRLISKTHPASSFSASCRLHNISVIGKGETQYACNSLEKRSTVHPWLSLWKSTVYYGNCSVVFGDMAVSLWSLQAHCQRNTRCLADLLFVPMCATVLKWCEDRECKWSI